MFTDKRLQLLNPVPIFIDVVCIRLHIGDHLLIFVQVTTALISRFILNLRQVSASCPASQMPGTASLHLSRFSAPRCADAVVGNLGAPLGHGATDDDDSNMVRVESGKKAEDQMAGLPESESEGRNDYGADSVDAQEFGEPSGSVNHNNWMEDESERRSMESIRQACVTGIPTLDELDVELLFGSTTKDLGEP